MINRLFNPPKKLSFFLFGARGTGKSTLLRELFPPARAVWFDLLDLNIESRFLRNPMSLEQELQAIPENSPQRWVVIDEIQKVPSLLDVVHRNIEKKRFQFALTGSSARKLKRGAANLLAGRADQNFLFPLTHLELKERFNLASVLRWGSLPETLELEDEEKAGFLRTYASTYLKEEIQIEQLVRKIVPFRNFLEIAAQTSGQIVNYSKIARDIGSDAVSVQSYFEILEDTLVGLRLPAFEKSIRKRQRKNPKFFLFDLGVLRALAGQLRTEPEPYTFEYGFLFEQWIILEIFRLSSYLKNDFRLSYLRTKDDVEIDLILERPGEKMALVEIKSSEQIHSEVLRPLSTLAKDFGKNAQAFCLSRDPVEKRIENVHCLPWQRGISLLLNIDNSKYTL